MAKSKIILPLSSLQFTSKISTEIRKTIRTHTRQNFHKQGFVDNGTHPWPDVKRRDPSSPWYGFTYKREKREDFPIKKGKRGKPLKRQKKLNFSKAATKRKILFSENKDLYESLDMKEVSMSKKKLVVSLVSDKEYAQYHNEGAKLRVFGKGSGILPKRQFIGKSAELDKKINKILVRNLSKQLKEIKKVTIKK